MRANAKPAETRLCDARVLLITRDGAQREALVDWMGRWGVAHALAETADGACQLILDAQPRRFDVAVLDGSVRERDEGSELLFDICTAEALPLVLLLSEAEEVDVAEDRGWRLCLTKPVAESELHDGLVSLLDGPPLVHHRSRGRAAGQIGQDSELCPTILVVDDDEINRLVVLELLSELGYAAEEAENGVRAVEKARSGKYAAIVMDCQMPGMDGYEAARTIRALPGPVARVPIIALTGSDTASDRDRALAAGMDDHAAKPVSARALERLFERFIGGRARAGGAPPHSGGAPRSNDGSPPHLDDGIPRSPRVVELFFRSAPELLASIVRAANEDDASELVGLAHKFKGSCLSLGAGALADALARVEAEAKAGRVDRATVGALPELLRAVAALLGEASTGARDGGA